MALDNAAPTAEVPNTALFGRCVNRCVEDLKREFVKTQYLATIPGLVVIFGQLTVGSPATIPGFVPALFSGVCVFGLFVILARRKYIPAIEMMMWTGDRQADILAEIDGNRESPDGDELLLERLAGRTGSGASFLRISALSGLGRATEARALLDAWQPTGPVDASRRERLAAKIDLDRADEHLARSAAAIAMISDPKERVSQRATLVLDAARVRRHETWPGLDALAAGRAELGSYYTSSQPVTKRPTYAVIFRAALIGTLFADVSLLITEPAGLGLLVLAVLLVVAIVGTLRAPR
jgi:hypothetical protein